MLETTVLKKEQKIVHNPITLTKLLDFSQFMNKNGNNIIHPQCSWEY